MELGFKRPVLFERQAVGGEYAAGWAMTKGTGTVKTVFYPDDVRNSRLDCASGKEQPSLVCELSLGVMSLMFLRAGSRSSSTIAKSPTRTAPL
eukprot:SAG31_NODE_948_length_10825_cov_9.412829_5_plen_93_part_00